MSDHTRILETIKELNFDIITLNIKQSGHTPELTSVTLKLMKK